MALTQFSRHKLRGILLLASLGCYLEYGFTNPSWAGLPEKEYWSQLKVANDLVVRKQTASSGTQTGDAQNLSSNLLNRLFGRYYRMGDSWIVAAWQFEHGMSRMTGDSDKTQSRLGRGGIFKYQVTSVKTGTHPEVVIRVTQEEQPKFPKVDPKVEYLQLTMSDTLMQSEKIYSLGPRSSLRTASPNGIHTEISPLELYPLDAPEVDFSLRAPAKMPELPNAIQSFLAQTRWNLKTSNALSFQQDDFFGRPIEMIWEQGKPWPSVLKTINGIAILLDRSTR